MIFSIQADTDSILFSKKEIDSLREEVREMFSHTYDNYMEKAFPADEIHPISCKARNPKLTPRGQLDDSLGNFSLTLVDSLDTLAVMGNFSAFEIGMDKLSASLNFDQDVTISLFETTIRVLGGLISIHLAAVEHSDKLEKEYDGKFLRLSEDLANRLLPAFQSPTGIPYSTVNLKRGLVLSSSRESRETCVAGAGTLILEFGTLARLTGNLTYERVAKKAMKELYSRRSPIDLVGNVLNVDHGTWIHSHSSIGAGADSFYEYCLKGFLLFGEEEYYSMFHTLNLALKRYVKRGGYYLASDMWLGGNIRPSMIDSLQAFWPGLLVLHGELEEAKDMHHKLHSIWRQSGFIPEAYDIHNRNAVRGWGGYPLRPEFVESTYFLYLATGDHFYLDVGKRIVQDLQGTMRVDCGFASIADPFTKRLEDRMDSFFLSETLKYLYLLFDEENIYNQGKHVFTTEGHPFPLQYIPKWEGDEKVCSERNEEPQRISLEGKMENLCTAPSNPLQFASLKVNYTSHFPANIWGINLQKYSAHHEHLSQQTTFPSSSVPNHDEQEVNEPSVVLKNEPLLALTFQLAEPKTQMPSIVHLRMKKPDLVKGIYTGSPDSFGPELNFTGVSGKMVVGFPETGCHPLWNVDQLKGNIVLLQRGQCTFIEKVKRVEEAGGIGVVFGNDRPNLISHFVMSGVPNLPLRSQTSIPSLLIGMYDYFIIKETILRGNELGEAEIFAESLEEVPEFTIGPVNAVIKDVVLKLQTPMTIIGMGEEHIRNWLTSEVARFGMNPNEIISMGAIYDEQELNHLVQKMQPQP